MDPFVLSNPGVDFKNLEERGWIWQTFCTFIMFQADLIFIAYFVWRTKSNFRNDSYDSFFLIKWFISGITCNWFWVVIVKAMEATGEVIPFKIFSSKNTIIFQLHDNHSDPDKIFDLVLNHRVSKLSDWLKKLAPDQVP